MSIKNDTEQLVRDEVSRVRKVIGARRLVCWCVLCVADVVALSLNLLPPLYCRTETYGHAATQLRSIRVRKAVLAALKKVIRSPRHLPDGKTASRQQVALVNYPYEIGENLIGPALVRSESVCDCAECRSDTLACALNRYPARYGVARDGRRFLLPGDLDFMRHELGILLTQAVRVISTHRHH